jgi:MFS family permease
MIINLFLFIIFELASGFCNTLPQFLGVRSLYGIAMGGKSSFSVPGGKFGGSFIYEYLPHLVGSNHVRQTDDL